MGEMKDVLIRKQMVEVVARIMRLTQQGKLVWKERNSQDLPILNRHSHEYVLVVFEIVSHDTKLRLDERHYKTYAKVRHGFLPALGGDKEKQETRWERDVILEIVGLDEMAVSEISKVAKKERNRPFDFWTLWTR